MKKLKRYSKEEERLNVISHFIGFLMAIVGFVMLAVRTFHDSATTFISALIFGFSMVLVYASSTAYHYAKKEDVRRRLKIADHAAIYILIAGTYTPFTLITLHNNKIGIILFWTAWGIALVGVILKLFFTGKYKILSTAMYLMMGWIIMFAIKPLSENLPTAGMVWFLLGGFFYTVGAIIYSVKKIKMNHAIFHLFVIGGTFSHFISIYYYIFMVTTN